MTKCRLLPFLSVVEKSYCQWKLWCTFYRFKRGKSVIFRKAPPLFWCGTEVLFLVILPSASELVAHSSQQYSEWLEKTVTVTGCWLCLRSVCVQGGRNYGRTIILSHLPCCRCPDSCHTQTIQHLLLKETQWKMLGIVNWIKFISGQVSMIN